ncbi:uncharacterized protein G2W53_017693 [Senna tora]|uniref:Uncharacterized protein n=1 Tax=Senna tora TaxID=362788 RepID=A0A834TYY5_9FABA|nr:uncharacterized protein G2W53_017693 [Senna tora]
MNQRTPPDDGRVGSDQVYSVIGRRSVSRGYCDGTVTALMVLRRDSRGGRSVLMGGERLDDVECLAISRRHRTTHLRLCLFDLCASPCRASPGALHSEPCLLHFGRSVAIVGCGFGAAPFEPADLFVRSFLPSFTRLVVDSVFEVILPKDDDVAEVGRRDDPADAPEKKGDGCASKPPVISDPPSSDAAIVEASLAGNRAILRSASWRDLQLVRNLMLRSCLGFPLSLTCPFIVLRLLAFGLDNVRPRASSSRPSVDPGASSSQPFVVPFEADDFSRTFRFSGHELEESGFFIRGSRMGYVLSLEINFIVLVEVQPDLDPASYDYVLHAQMFPVGGDVSRRIPAACSSPFVPLFRPLVAGTFGVLIWSFCASRFDSMHDFVQTLRLSVLIMVETRLQDTEAHVQLARMLGYSTVISQWVHCGFRPYGGVWILSRLGMMIRHLHFTFGFVLLYLERGF